MTLEQLTDQMQTLPADEGFTVAEVLEKIGTPDNDHARDRVRRFLKEEIKAGRIKGSVGRRVSITGKAVAVPVYEIVSKKKSSK